MTLEDLNIGGGEVQTTNDTTMISASQNNGPIREIERVQSNGSLVPA